MNEPLQEDLDFLEHFGVKGMQWGVRKSSTPGVSRSTDRTARKDAKEFAAAKMYYGKGAGTRRKLIKAKVEERSKHNDGYKKAFDNHLSKQDMGKHADKAVSKRHRTDIKDRNKQRAGFIARRMTGEMGTQAAFTAAALGGVAFVKSPKGQAFMNKSMREVKNFINK